MGFLEAAVVIYLRKIYYPDGFGFPLAPVHHEIAVTELFRELATLIMLMSIGALAGRNRAERFGYFLYSFAVWDICYYLFLKVFINWPDSFFTWDILFLIPVPWVGPVIAPVIIAFTMILFAGTIIYFSGQTLPVRMRKIESIVLWLGAVTTIISFTLDYTEHKGSVLLNNITSKGSLFTDLVDYVPMRFDWNLFLLAEAIILLSFFLYANRLIKAKKGLSRRDTEDMDFY